MFGTIQLLSKQNVKSVSYIVLRQISKVSLEPNKIKQAVPLYVNREEEFKIRKKNTIKKLEELLNFRKNYATEIVSKCEEFLKIPSFYIGENYYSCINQGITKDTLIDYPEILASNHILMKLELLKTLDYDINITAPLLSFKLNIIQNFASKEKEIGRIKVLSSLFQVDAREVCRWLSKKPFLISLDLDRIEANTKLLQGYGIPINKIIGDLWVLRYSTDGIKMRMDMAKENNLETLKTWMVRVEPEIFKNYVRRRSDNKLILGNNSLAEYISERLVCSEEIAKYIISKHPALQNKSLKKLNEMIDFLFMCGYKPIHICKTPKILLHSVETIRKRLKELEEQGTKLDTLHILTKSQKQYTQFCESLKGNKSKR